MELKIINRTKLQSLMVERGMSIADLAEELCITYAGAYNKVRKNRDFSEKEIYILFTLFGKDVFFDTVKSRNKRKVE